MSGPKQYRTSLGWAVPILMSVFLTSCQATPGAGGTIIPAPTLPTPEPAQPSSTSVPPKPTVQPASATPESAIPPGYRPSEPLDPNRELDLTTVDMIDALVGWSKAWPLHVLRTQDGGQSWRDVSPPVPVASKSGEGRAFFLDSSHAWMAFDAYDLDEQTRGQQLVWRTTDGGETWDPGPRLDLTGADEFLVTSISFVDREAGWLLATVGNAPGTTFPSEPGWNVRSALFGTVDGGESWTRIEFDKVGDGHLLNTTGERGMEFADRQTGLIWPASTDPLFLLWSDDGGSTWERRDLPAPDWYPSAFECYQIDSQLISALSSAVLVRCIDKIGHSRMALYRTEDGAGTWQTFPVSQLESIWSMDFLDHDTGFLFGPTIYKTKDGGRSWRAVKQLSWDEGRFDFVNADLGWAVAVDNSRMGISQYAVVHTEDGGTTWKELKPRLLPQAGPSPAKTPSQPAAAEALKQVVDASLMRGGFGWAWNGGRRLLTTADSGETWRERALPESAPAFIGAVFFFDSNVGWVVAEDPDAETIALLSTKDGGQAWQVQESGFESPYGDPGYVIDVWFLDAQHGWVSVDFTATMNSSTGVLLRTADGGRSWIQSDLPNAGPIMFNSPSIGWTIGNFNNGARKVLYRTLDGGGTWQPQTVLPEPVDDGVQYNDYLLPTFFNKREGILPVLLSDAGYELTGVGFYRTQDAGNSWSLVSTLPAPLSSWEWGQAAVDIVDSTTWLAASDDGVLHVTLDGGGHWQAVELAEGQPRPTFWGLSFAGQTSGWGLGYEDCQGGVVNCLQLYRTDDGGRHWSLLRVGE